jgi:hypothetical protein
VEWLLRRTVALATFAVVLSVSAPKEPTPAIARVPSPAHSASVVAGAAPIAEPTPRATTPQPDTLEVAALVKRGLRLGAAGDVAAARLMLLRAADAHDAGAAWALGATYDPGVLTALGIRGVEPDMAAARRWYAKAKEYGAGHASPSL